MVAVFTGLGAGFTRGSANLLGGAGQIGSGLLGRAGEGVSVNAATGGLLLSHQDEFLIGKGPDVALSRTYNSITDASGGDRDNGDNWHHSTTRRVFGLTSRRRSARARGLNFTRPIMPRLPTSRIAHRAASAR